MYVLVILPPPDPTCCGRLSRNCVELLYGTLTTIPSWLSYTVPLLYPSDWVPQIIKGGTHTPSTVCPFGALANSTTLDSSLSGLSTICMGSPVLIAVSTAVCFVMYPYP